MQQETLWHETLEDALKDVVVALGGPKKVGSQLWPALPIEDAARKLNHCLDRDKPNKLSPDELLWLLRAGVEAGCLTPLTFINRFCKCEDAKPLDPETEKERLMREFMHAQRQMALMAGRLETLLGGPSSQPASEPA